MGRGFTKKSALRTYLPVVLCGVFVFLFSNLVSGRVAIAQETPLAVVDAVYVFAYDQDKPSEIQPLYIGDAVPSTAIIYLPEASCRLSLQSAEQGEEIKFEAPGFYDTSGKPLDLPEEVRARIVELVDTHVKTKPEAEKLKRDAQAETLGLAVDDPQRVPSPST